MQLTRVDCNGFVVNTIRDERVIVSVRPFPINENTIGHSQFFPVFKTFPQSLRWKEQEIIYPMKQLLTIPTSTKISDKEIKLTVWFRVYQSPIMIVISPSGVSKGIGIITLLLIVNPP